MPPKQQGPDFRRGVGMAVAGVFGVLHEYIAVLKVDVGPGQFQALAHPHPAEQRQSRIYLNLPQGSP
jgi:hypothetical protein